MYLVLLPYTQPTYLYSVMLFDSKYVYYWLPQLKKYFGHNEYEQKL
jgi:hypothetical protein